MKPRHCLVTLPCRLLGSHATYMPEHGRPLRITPQCKAKALRTAELTRAHLGVTAFGGHIVIESNIEEGKGCGSSTADCVAASEAIADAFGTRVPNETLAQLVVTGEIASDSVIFSDAVLFAQREGVILENYGEQLPNFEVLGFDLGGTVDTLACPSPSYEARDIRAFAQLLAGLRSAIRTGNLRMLGEIATRSACINNRFRPKPQFHEIRRLSQRMGALGISVAHSGTVMSILLDPCDPRLELRVEQLSTALAALEICSTLRFHTNAGW